jgi:hypothetical protein
MISSQILLNFCQILTTENSDLTTTLIKQQVDQNVRMEIIYHYHDPV